MAMKNNLLLESSAITDGNQNHTLIESFNLSQSQFTAHDPAALSHLKDLRQASRIQTEALHHQTPPSNERAKLALASLLHSKVSLSQTRSQFQAFVLLKDNLRLRQIKQANQMLQQMSKLSRNFVGVSNLVKVLGKL